MTLEMTYYEQYFCLGHCQKIVEFSTRGDFEDAKTYFWKVVNSL